jgi:hypothetical protein
VVSLTIWNAPLVAFRGWLAKQHLLLIRDTSGNGEAFTLTGRTSLELGCSRGVFWGRVKRTSKICPVVLEGTKASA